MSFFYKKYKDLDIINDVLKFLRPAIVAMILIAGIDILKTALFDTRALEIANIDIKMLVLFFLALFIMLKKKTDPIKIMLASGAIYLGLAIIL